LTIGILFQAGQILLHNQADPVVTWGTALVASLGLLQIFDLRTLRLPVTAIASIVFVVVGSLVIVHHGKDFTIDVFMFQQMSADGLLRGQDPYTIRYPSLYPLGTPYYGPGVVDASNMLQYGFPYPPLSLLLVLPAYAIAGDVRFASVIAVAATAGLMAAARPGRWAALIAVLFLLTPTVFFVVERSWTEPLLALIFSLVMFCALRWRRGLPYALGLLVATKQYTVLMVPLVWLLLEDPVAWKQLASVFIKAAIVALAITLPFFLWDPRAFYRAVIVFQFLQPFRLDALSYSVWIHHNYPQLRIETWAPFLSALPAIAFALWRCPRTPAGFAAAVTIVYLVFFAFNKQAFCNYYYLVIATACWSAASINDARGVRL
jgi:hypothetical protein